MTDEVKMHVKVFHSIIDHHRDHARQLQAENERLRKALAPFVALQPFRGYKAEENHLREVFIYTDDLEAADRALS